MKTFAGLVLAGGQATRMGGIDKPLVSLGPSRLIDLVLARLSPQVDAVAISANSSFDDYKALEHPVLPDQLDGHLGPLAGIHAGLIWASAQGYSHMLSVAGDTPFLPTDLATKLADGLTDTQTIAMAAINHPRHPLQPTLALWPTGLAGDLGDALVCGTRKIVAWAEPHGIAPVRFATKPVDPFFNVNTPEDLAKAKAILAKGET